MIQNGSHSNGYKQLELVEVAQNINRWENFKCCLKNKTNKIFFLILYTGLKLVTFAKLSNSVLVSNLPSDIPYKWS